jgi:hypothetical protein
MPEKVVRHSGRSKFGCPIPWEGRCGIKEVWPGHRSGRREVDWAGLVERLGTHPSRAGGVVGHLAQISDDIAQCIQELDPTRSVFRQFPVDTLDTAA